ncbi:hypothetical protein ACFFF7_02425 [Novosphingobium aquiterrae]|uniref:Transporter n=1 Tax=Novosphingobium aquiterrae TaxID=624388 RepID=A0ABV6PEK9_9SPHN
MKFPIVVLVGVALLGPSPALAHHTGPTGIGGNGGGLTVQGPETIEAGKGAVGFQLTYLRTKQRSATELEDLAALDIHAHDTDYIATAVIGAAYGVSDRLTLIAELPYLRRAGLREGEALPVSGVNDLGNISSLGDASILAKYRLVGSDISGAALIGGIKLPTGSTDRMSRVGELLETEHQPGSGSWDYYLGGAAGTEVGWVSIDASLLYQFSTSGAQATRLGDRLQGGVALSHRFGPAEHHHDHAGGADNEEHAHQSWDAFAEATVEWEGRQKVAGVVEEATGGTAIWMTAGSRLNAASGYSVTVAAGVPIWQDIRPSHADNRYRFTLSLAKAF